MLLWFKEADASDIQITGGKGANLAKMTRAGFPVPPGFCLTAAAYKTHIETSGLWPQIAALTEGITTDDAAALDRAAARIRELIEAAPMPGIVSGPVLAAYARLKETGCFRVAVRSSATAEDLPSASFAGQQETFLSVRGEDAVLLYIRKCWASLCTSRAITYRNRNGFAHRDVSLAVVIQGMVEAEKAGVLFTVNPLTGRRDEMLVNASYGLGESIVSGRVTPDSYRLSRKSAALIIEQQLGSKQTLIRSAEAGLTAEEAVPESARCTFCLGQEELRQLLLLLGKKVEKYYRAPQDIE